MSYIGYIHNSQTNKVRLAKQYAAKYPNDFVLSFDNDCVKIEATQYIGQSFKNKIKNTK